MLALLALTLAVVVTFPLKLPILPFNCRFTFTVLAVSVLLKAMFDTPVIFAGKLIKNGTEPLVIKARGPGDAFEPVERSRVELSIRT